MRRDAFHRVLETVRQPIENHFTRVGTMTETELRRDRRQNAIKAVGTWTLVTAGVFIGANIFRSDNLAIGWTGRIISTIAEGTALGTAMYYTAFALDSQAEINLLAFMNSQPNYSVEQPDIAVLEEEPVLGTNKDITY